MDKLEHLTTMHTLATLHNRASERAEDCERGGYSFRARDIRKTMDAIGDAMRRAAADALALPAPILATLRELLDSMESIVHPVCVPRDTSRAPFLLSAMHPLAALESLLRYHVWHLAALDFIVDTVAELAQGQALDIVKLASDPIDGFQTGTFLVGAWDARYKDDAGDPTFRIVLGVSEDRTTILRPYTPIGIVRIATLADVESVDASKIARAWDFDDIGVEHSQYFRGAGLEDYDDVATGIGNTPREALDDALDMLGSNGWDTQALALAILAAHPRAEWDKDFVSAELETQTEPATLRLQFSAHCGMSTLDETFYDAASAANRIRGILAEREESGHVIDAMDAIVDDGTMQEWTDAQEAHDGDASWEWDIGEPEDSAMVPDTAGILSLTVIPGVSLESLQEDCELHYHFVVRVSERVAQED